MPRCNSSSSPRSSTPDVAGLVPQSACLPARLGRRQSRAGRAVAARVGPVLRALPPRHVGLQHDADQAAQLPVQPVGLAGPGAPTSFFYEGPKKGELGCAVDQCSQAVHTIGTISLWWAGLVALFVVLHQWLARRDWRGGRSRRAWSRAMASGSTGRSARSSRSTRSPSSRSSCSPSSWSSDSSCVLPSRRSARPTRQLRVVGIAAYLVVHVALFTYFYPIHAAEVIPYKEWYLRMWFPSWI